MDNYLEKELGKRLTSIARLSDRILKRDYIADLLEGKEPEFALFFLKQDWNQLVNNEELQATFIRDRSYQVLVDGGSEFPMDQLQIYLQQDSSAIDQAWQSEIAVSSLHGVGGNQFKNVYAPIREVSLEIPSLPVLEATANFFEILGLFKRG